MRSRKDSQMVSTRSLPLYTSCLFFMILNNSIVDEIYSQTFFMDEFSESSVSPHIHQSVLLNIKDLHK